MGDHTEALQIDFDPTILSYTDVMGLFWSAHDPTHPHWSAQYKAAVWCQDDSQLAAASALGDEAAAEHGAARTTEVLPVGPFYLAEDYHQKYRLRREPALTEELVARYGNDKAMVRSTAAARINGYLRGFGRRHELLDRLDELGLSPAGNQVLLARIP